MPPSEPNADPKSVFFDLFEKHWNAGTGRSAGANRKYRQWTPKEFADALSAAGAPTDTDTIGKWLKRLHLPRSQLTAILCTFFGPTAAHEDSAAMRKAWTEANARPPRPRRTLAEEANAPRFRIYDDFETTDLVEFRLHHPPPSNATETFRLEATLRFGTLETEHEGHPVAITLTEAEIAIDSKAYQPEQASRIDERNPAHPNLKPEAGFIRVTGPNSNQGLNGDPLGDDHLAIMVRKDEAEGPVTVGVRARPRQFNVTTDGAPPSTNARAVLDAVFADGERRDPQGRLLVARARLRRRTAE